MTWIIITDIWQVLPFFHYITFISTYSIYFLFSVDGDNDQQQDTGYYRNKGRGGGRGRFGRGGGGRGRKFY